MPRGTPGRIVLAAFAALSAGGFARGNGADPGTLATPPHQADPWSPPATKLPKFLVSATRILFEQGLADPRGCEYRRIEVKVGNEWGVGAADARTHGWVLPRAKDRDEDFAVCWNGLVYPVVKLGDKADLDADIRALVDSAKAERAEVQKSPYFRTVGGILVGDRDFPESIAVAVKQPQAIKICLLLRLGRADLAEPFFAAATVWKPDATGGRDLTDYGISYLTMASDWAWCLFDRAVNAHARGDDRVALADSRLLVEARKKIEARATAMGFARPQQGVGNRADRPYLEFLGPLDALHDDQERRAREPVRGEVPPRGADPAPRIAALIRDLDQIAPHPMPRRPGGIPMWMEPAVAAIIAEGDAAVDPLLRVLESDTRLTRLASGSEAFRRGPSRQRTMTTVADAAYSALTRILRMTDFGGNPDYVLVHGGPDGRKKLAGAIRAYWEKNKGVSPAERWFRTLLDDDAPIARWQEAAYNLLQPLNLNQPPAKPGEAISVEADALRDRRDPSLSELLARRALALARLDRDPRPGEGFPVDVASNLALALHRWEPKAARPVLATVMKRCFDELTGKAASRAPSTRYALLNNLPRLAEALAASGDLAAVDQAAEIVRRLTARDMVSFPGPLFDLMARYPRHPALATAADWLFNDPNSPWLAELRRTHFQMLAHRLRLKPGMLGVAGFRKQLEVLLDDTSEMGTVTVFEQNKTRNRVIRWNDQDSRGGTAGRLDPSAPKPVSESAFRTCDYVAWQLAFSGLAGMPKFELEWPQPAPRRGHRSVPRGPEASRSLRGRVWRRLRSSRPPAARPPAAAP